MKTRRPIPDLTPRQLVRFLDNVNKIPHGCWEWQGHTLNGYGRIKLQDSYYMTHRVSWAVYRTRPVPQHLDHNCRNRKCCNPAHLEAVTARQNTLRSTSPSAINAHKTYCVNGHELSEENVYTVAARPRARYCKPCTISRTYAARAKKACAVWFVKQLAGVEK